MKRRSFLGQIALGLGAIAIASKPAWSQTTPIDPLVLHVVNRLSFGAAPGELAQVQEMGVDRYIETQLNPETIPLPEALEAQLASFGDLGGTAGDLTYRYFTPVQAEGREAKNKALQENGRTNVKSASQAKLVRAIASPRQLEEVLTDFWFNHFNVHSGKGLTKLWIASYERDAIRPQVLGKFRSLLGASAHHPAMLFYLDNWQSSKQGLNENYARELMELHTLGVDGGYTQADVLSLAKILTGWTLAPYAKPDPSGFYFNPNRHDNSIQQFLGKPLGKSGVAQGEAALDILAKHPATAKFVSYKLAQYFVSDRPPQALVTQMQKRFLATDGDLREVLKTLFESTAFRNPKVFQRKYKTPYQYVVSAVRSTGITLEKPDPLILTLQQFSMPLYGCPTPDGYKQTETAWLNPDSMVRRLNFAIALGNGRSGLTTEVKPVTVNSLQTTVLPQLKPKTQQQIATQSVSLRSGLMLGSPEFMYR
jgi:uncharacterized protein (DUF1800 family)